MIAVFGLHQGQKMFRQVGGTTVGKSWQRLLMDKKFLNPNEKALRQQFQRFQNVVPPFNKIKEMSL